MTNIEKWSTDSSDVSLTANDVRSAIGPLADYPDNTFHIHHSTLVNRQSVHARLARLVMTHRSGYILVLGAPGSGKSTALNSVGPRSQLGRQHSVIVYNCFTEPGDTFQCKRASGDNFALFLAKQLHEKLKVSGTGPLVARAQDIEELLVDGARSLKRGEGIIIIIDGFDYAKRNQVPGEIALFNCLPRQLPPNVLLVVSAQSLDQVPGHLKGLDKSRILNVPALTRTETAQLLQKHGVFTAVGAKASYYRQMTTRAVYSCSHGHPLHTTYVARALLKAKARVEDVEKFLKSIPAYDTNIQNYYAGLLGRPETRERTLLKFLAACPFPLSAAELSMLSGSTNPIADSDALESISMLLEPKGDKIAIAHDSLRAFIMDQSWGRITDRRPFLDFLKSQVGDPRFGEHILPLAIECGETDWAKKTIDCDWLAAQQFVGAKADLILEGLERLARNAAEKQDWTAMGKWCLLRERCDLASDFELPGSVLLEALLANGDEKTVDRLAIDGESLVCSWQLALKLAVIAEKYGKKDLARRLRALVAEKNPFEETPSHLRLDWQKDASAYFRNLGQFVGPKEVYRQIKQMLITHELQIHRQKVETVTAHYASIAAFGSIDSDNTALTESWLKVRLPKHIVHRLRLIIQLRLSKKLASKQAFAAALKGPTDWNLLERIAQDDPCMAAKYVEAMPLPESLTRSKSDWFEQKECYEDASTFYRDCQLSFRLGLTSRLVNLKRSAAQPATPAAGPLHQILFLLAERLSKPDATKNWSSAANECLSILPSMNSWGENFHEAHATRFFMQSAGKMLKPLRQAAREAGQSPAFGDWVQQELIPQLKQLPFFCTATLESVLQELVDPKSCPIVYNAILDEVSNEWRSACEIKSEALLRLSILASKIDRKKAHQLLKDGIRAAFTYGYHKDMTVNAAIECLRNVGAHLKKDELKKAAITLCATLEILDKLTDLDHVNDNAGELIAVLCRFDVKLAARAAKFLRDRLSPYMWRTSIRKALEQAGLDVAKIGSELIKVESTLSLGAGRSKKVEEHSPEHAMSFEEAATALTKHHKFTLDANYRLRQQLVDLCADKGQIEKAAAILTDAGDLARLALRAHALKEDALARQYSQRSVHDGKPLLGWNWDWDQSEALDLLCKLDSTRAAPIFQEAVLASMEEPYYLGHVSQAVICMCLMSLGLVEEAKSLFQEFLGFLREITKVYPSMENELERDWA